MSSWFGLHALPIGLRTPGISDSTCNQVFFKEVGLAMPCRPYNPDSQSISRMKPVMTYTKAQKKPESPTWCGLWAQKSQNVRPLILRAREGLMIAVSGSRAARPHERCLTHGAETEATDGKEEALRRQSPCNIGVLRICSCVIP